MGDRQTDPRHGFAPRRTQGLSARHDPLLLRRPRAPAHLRRTPRAPRPARPRPPRAAQSQQQPGASRRAAQAGSGSRPLPGQLRPTDRGASDARAAGRAGGAIGGLDRQAHRNGRRAKGARGRARRPGPLRARACYGARSPPAWPPTTSPTRRSTCSPLSISPSSTPPRSSRPNPWAARGHGCSSRSRRSSSQAAPPSRRPPMRMAAPRGLRRSPVLHFFWKCTHHHEGRHPTSSWDSLSPPPSRRLLDSQDPVQSDTGLLVPSEGG